MNQTYDQIKSDIDTNVVNDKTILGNYLNTLFTNFLDSFQFKFVVASTGARDALADKYAGMLVYVTGDTLYVLENDLTTWSKWNKNSYTNSQIDTLLAQKVDIDSSDSGFANIRDFTLPLLNKLNAIQDGATKIAQLSDASWLQTLITNLQAAVLVSKKTIQTAVHLTTPEIVTMTALFNTLLVDATIGEIIVNLPDATLSQNQGIIFTIKRIDSNLGNKVKIHPFSFDSSDSNTSQLIEFNVHLHLESQGQVAQLTAYNGNWYKLN